MKKILFVYFYSISIIQASRITVNPQVFNSAYFKPFRICKNPSKAERYKVGKAKSNNENWVIVQSILIPPNQDEIFRIINENTKDFINQDWRENKRCKENLVYSRVVNTSPLPT